MTKVAILPILNPKNDIFYHAVAGNKQSQGRTAGEALDALTSQLDDEEKNTWVIIQSLRPDRFFNAEQQQRLVDLMNDWRVARDQGETLSAHQQAELEKLVKAELRASMNRAEALADELRQ